jgi:hypothetical protein
MQFQQANKEQVTQLLIHVSITLSNHYHMIMLSEVRCAHFRGFEGRLLVGGPIIPHLSARDLELNAN